MIDQGLVCFGNLPELFSGGTDPKVWMVAADEYSIRTADCFVIRISRNAENSVEVHAASLQKTIKVLMEGWPRRPSRLPAYAGGARVALRTSSSRE
jgi:hypothetical protein